MPKVFNSLGELATFLDRVPARLDTERGKALRTVGENTAERARDKLGVYQEGVGIFPSWAPLTKFTQAERVKLGFSADEPLLRTGELRDSIGSSVDGDMASVGSPLEKAAAMENGEPLKNVPARPFIGPAMLEEDQRNGIVMRQAIVDAFTKD